MLASSAGGTAAERGVDAAAVAHAAGAPAA
jgi:hypothetical protein